MGFQTPLIRGDDEFDPETGCKLVSTVSDFDIDMYASAPWYIQQQMEIAYLPIENNYCVVAQYTVRQNPTFFGYTVDVFNQAQNELGTVFGGDLCAYQTGDEGDDLSKLAVAVCFLPKSFAGPYWVLAYDEDEGYALISGGQPYIPTDPNDLSLGCSTGTGVNDSGLWIFTRVQERNETLVQMVRDMAEDFGFDLSVLNDIDHTNCGVCEDTDEDFSLFGFNVDCGFIGLLPSILCLFASDECPETCGACEI